MSKIKKFDFAGIERQARELRINMTESEKLIWNELRGRKLSGYKFLRQHVILYKGNLKRYNYFIADFFCFEKKAVLELDGPIHDKTDEYDEFRDSELEEIGIHVLRIRNEELENTEKVLNKIRQFLDQII
ncbi:MAG: endonuclease domain-containing protein [Bacteroidia bacterium]|nr:endonuclease domain-containing protein [Bacteroidia bacterium]